MQGTCAEDALATTSWFEWLINGVGIDSEDEEDQPGEENLGEPTDALLDLMDEITTARVLLCSKSLFERAHMKGNRECFFELKPEEQAEQRQR